MGVVQKRLGAPERRSVFCDTGSSVGTCSKVWYLMLVEW